MRWNIFTGAAVVLLHQHHVQLHCTGASVRSAAQLRLSMMRQSLRGRGFDSTTVEPVQEDPVRKASELGVADD